MLYFALFARMKSQALITSATVAWPWSFITSIENSSAFAAELLVEAGGIAPLVGLDDDVERLVRGLGDRVAQGCPDLRKVAARAVRPMVGTSRRRPRRHGEEDSERRDSHAGPPAAATP